MSNRNTGAVRVQDTDWYKSRPPAVQRRIDEDPPSGLYRLRSTGQIVWLYSYGEGADGQCDTCTVVVSGKYNPGVVVERGVFGVSFADLEPIDAAHEMEQREASDHDR